MAEAFRNQARPEALARLVEPSEHFRSGFPGDAEDFAAYLQMLQVQEVGIGLRPGIVPMSTYWLIDPSGEVVGESHLRHRLTPALENYGGHIGYRIQPAHRRRGFGNVILALTLEKAAERGIRRIRITCDTENIASARIIENNGGIFSGHGVSPVNGKPTSQYWIEL